MPELNGASAFPRSCLPLSLSPHMCACVGWRACFPDVLSPIVSPHVLDGVFWMVSWSRPCVSLSRIASHCPLSHCLPVSPHMCACVGWRVRLPEVSSCLPLSPFLFPCVGWCVHLPEALSQLVSQLVSQFVSRLVSFSGGGFILNFSANSVLLAALNAFLRCPPWCRMVCPSSRGLVSHLVPLLVFFGWFHFGFSPSSVLLGPNRGSWWFLNVSHAFEPVPQNTSWIHPLFGVYGGVMLDLG